MADVCSFSRLTEMGSWMRPRSTVPYALWLGGLLVLLGGLFGMHGLDNHGGAGMDTVVNATMTGSIGLAGAVAGEVMTETAPEVALATVTATGASGRSDMDMGVAGMCMAVLMVGLIALLLRIRANRLHPPLLFVPRPARSPGARSRDPDTPSLIQLSIQRC